MPKRTPICVRPIKQGKYRFQVPIPPELNGGKRERKFFVLRKEAQLFAADLQVQKDNFGTRLLQIPESLRQEALDCVERFKLLQTTLSEAVEFYVQHCHRTTKSRTVSELVESVLAAKTASNRAKRYLNDLRLICGDLARLHGG